MTDVLKKHAPAFVALCESTGFAPDAEIVEAITRALAQAWRDGYAAAANEYETEDLEPGETPCPIDGEGAYADVRHPSEKFGVQS